ncbi:ATP-binding protein [Actinomycetospora sp. NBRC 106375]|uniref:ATP-binding protein n=1 Tax=Actinomycetospora sp. NBRC 106375 TaxID=3032207 RepID=UPI002555FA1B|nr:ATP-binding protein [Actinomycetospora sp. NBRC 106375]
MTRDVVRPEDLRALRTELMTHVRAAAGDPDAAEERDDPALADQLADVATALYEALTNVVDHAYPHGAGPVRVTARVAAGRPGPEPAREPGPPWLEIEVADHGDWRPAPTDPGHRGRGLVLLARLADGHDLRTGPAGTRVRLWWHRPA